MSVTPKAGERNALSRADAATSILVYGLGLGGLFVLDLSLSARLPDRDLADWALTRNLVLFGAMFCLLGVDQAVLRRPAPFSSLWPGLVGQALVLACPIALIAWIAPNSISPIAIYIAVVGLTVLGGVSGINRATYRVSSSHATFHLWKLPLAAVALITLGSGPGIEWKLAAVIAIWTAGSAAVESRATVGEVEGRYRDLLPVGLRFWLSALVAGGLAYFDQILLNLINEPEPAALYFRHVATFLAIPLIATGFLANLVNPYLRQSGDALRSSWRGLASKYAIVCVVTVLGSSVVGLVADWQLDTLSGQLDTSLLGLVSLLAGTRMAYLGPSAVVGVFGNKAHLDNLLRGTLASIPLLAAIFLGLMTLDVTASYSMAAGLLAASGLRLVWSWRIASTILHGEEELRLAL